MTLLAAIAVAAALGSSLTGATSSGNGRDPGVALFRGPYVATRVISNGDPDPIVKGTRIGVTFSHERKRDFAGWSAGCNAFGARVRIKPRHLEIGAISGTAMACSKPIMRQERWVARLLGRDPKWRHGGRRLSLRADDDVIKLRRRE